LKLKSLKLKNFKGIKQFMLDTQGHNINIYGDNATGKTTLFDAFTWLLFDKDSQNRKDFEIKTLDETGRPFHGLEHEVEATLDIDGKQLALRKVFKEKWTKKRGSATAEFTGHTTDYFVDDVPVQKKEYETKIAEIVDENIFKLLTNPLYFNEQLHWQERRKILIKVCGDISDEDVIATDKSLSKLTEILQGRRLDDHRKIIAAQKAEINKELEKIPVRISEVQFGLPNIDGVVVEKLDEDIVKLKNELHSKQQELASIESGGAIAEKTKELAQIETEILKAQNEYRIKVEQQINEKQKKLSELSTKATSLLPKAILPVLDTTELEKEIEDLRQKWYEANKEEFACSDVCPTCGQPIPEEKIEEARVNFNREKSENLEKITAMGKDKKAKLEKIKAEYQEKAKQAEEANVEIQKLNAEFEKIKKEIEEIRVAEPVVDDALLNKKQKIAQEIINIKNGNIEAVKEIKEEIAKIELGISALEEVKTKVKRYEEGRKRIDELQAQERQLAKEYEKLEGELYLTEQFIRTKVKLLEEKINSKFKLARFKLFDVQVNGAVVECCETVYNGVPYSNLNHGAQINIGLDIINTLSEHFNFDAPIFIDNAEAITQLLHTRGQQIRLIVSAQDKKLRTEVI